MEHQLEELVREIEYRRSWSQRRWKGNFNSRSRGNYSRELKNLQSNINYEGRSRDGETRRGIGGGIKELFLMKKIIISWNIRRLVKEEKWSVKECSWEVEDRYSNFTKTKLQQISGRILRDLWGRLSIQFIHKPSEGSVGGILVAWNSKTIDVSNLKIGDISVSVLWRNKDDGARWVFSGVSGPCDQEASARLWEELSNIMGEWKVPQCSGGGFNALRFPSKRLGDSRSTQHMRLFNVFIENHDLVDLPLKGSTFSWSNR